MAITKIKKIYATVIKAADYITDEKKTTLKDEKGNSISNAAEYISNSLKVQDHSLLEYYNCGNSPLEAAHCFAKTKERGSGRSTVLANHIIQSFAPNETTPQQVFEVGKKLAERFLKGEYQYILAVHNDREHIHSHIVFCNTNMLNYKTFITNEDRKKGAWKTLRIVSDELCKEYGLSVLKDTELSGEKGKSYYEYSIIGESLSWKNQLKIIINAVISQADNFDDFLRKMREFGVECEYKPDNVIKLKYKLNGQQKYTRARTLGSPYDVDGITERIEKYKQFFEGNNIYIPHIHIIDTTAQTMQDNEYLERWAKVQNMKTVANLLIDLERKGIANISELSYKVDGLRAERQSHIAQKNTAKNKLAAFEVLLANVENFRRFKPIRDEYLELRDKKFGSKKAEQYYTEHKQELADFKTAVQVLKGYEFQDGKLPYTHKLQNSVELTRTALADEDSKIKALSNSIGELSAMHEALEKYLHPEREAPDRQRDERDCEENEL